MWCAIPISLGKSLLSDFPSFRGRIPGAMSELSTEIYLQILSAGCDLNRAVHSFLHAHICIHSRRLQSPVGWIRLEESGFSRQAQSIQPTSMEAG